MKKIHTKDFAINKMLRKYEQKAAQNKASKKQGELEYKIGLHKVTI